MTYSKSLGVGKLVALALALALGACGGGGAGSGVGPEGSAQAGADYFPLKVGDAWFYNSNHDNLGVNEFRVTGTRVVDGRTVFVVSITDNYGKTEQLYEKTSSGVMVVPGPGANRLDLAIAKAPVLRLPLVAGQTQVPVDVSLADAGDLDNDGRADSAQVHIEITVVGFESLTTPAGSWNNVAHLRTVIEETVTLSSTGRTTSVTGTSDDWYAPDVGQVQSEYLLSGDGRSQSDKQSLIAFHAGALRSESVAPTVLSRTPDAGSATRDPVFKVVFSEPMDSYVGEAGPLIIYGPDGSQVREGFVWQDDHTLTHPYLKYGGLASGNYTASISANLRDLAGNAVSGELSWTFSVDRQGPAAVSVTPADGATDVPLTSPVTIVFDETLDPASITADHIQFRDIGGPLPTTLTLKGNTVTVTPLQPMVRGAEYSVRIVDVLDRFGNGSDYRVVTSFKADTGRFGLPQALPGNLRLELSPGLALDLNGDQRVDAVVVGAVDNFTVPGVFVFFQQSDGSLAAPQAVPLQTTCRVFDVTAGDVNGDGQVDLVVSHRCGIEVLQRTAEGQWLTTATFNLESPTNTRVLRSTGRPSIVALQGVTPLVWRQPVTGTFFTPVSVPTAFQVVHSLEVADMNGDGLDDLLMTGTQRSVNSVGIEVMLQRADGRFETSQVVYGSGCWNYTSVTAADLNNDGRTDLLAIGNCLGDRQLTMLLQGAGGSFTPGATLPLRFPISLSYVAVNDVDGDGRSDLITAYDGMVGIFLQRADGSMAPESLYSGNSPWGGFAIGDLNGDGRVDILIGDSVLLQKAVPVGASTVNPDRRAAIAQKLLWEVSPIAHRRSILRTRLSK